jgi:hypothetical protein
VGKFPYKNSLVGQFDYQAVVDQGLEGGPYRGPADLELGGYVIFLEPLAGFVVLFDDAHFDDLINLIS